MKVGFHSRRQRAPEHYRQLNSILVSPHSIINLDTPRLHGRSDDIYKAFLTNRKSNKHLRLPSSIESHPVSSQLLSFIYPSIPSNRLGRQITMAFWEGPDGKIYTTNFEGGPLANSGMVEIQSEHGPAALEAMIAEQFGVVRPGRDGGAAGAAGAAGVARFRLNPAGYYELISVTGGPAGGIAQPAGVVPAVIPARPGPPPGFIHPGLLGIEPLPAALPPVQAAPNWLLQPQHGQGVPFNAAQFMPGIFPQLGAPAQAPAMPGQMYGQKPWVGPRPPNPN